MMTDGKREKQEKTKKNTEKMKNWLSHLFNISDHEWPRVIYAWFLEFWVMGAHVLGHAILIAVVASHFGAGSLPVLWIVAALLTVLATAVLTPLLGKFEKKKLILGLGGVGALLLGGAFLTLQMGLAPVWFLGLGLVGMAGVGGFLHIVIGLQVEDLFTPLEAERIFPVVSSSALIGGLITGFGITVLTGNAFGWGILPLVLVWAGFLGMVVLTQIFWEMKGEEVSHLKNEKMPKKGMIADLGEAVGHLKKVSFAKKLAGVVVLQLIVVQLVEFQWATALAADAHGSESTLIHGLGFWGAIAAGFALVMQILWSRKAVHKLGIVRTMMLNPLLVVVPFSVLAVKFGVGSAVTAKIVHDSTQAISRNAYLASFYAIPERIREHVKPLLEGWLAPFGAILGTGFLIFLGEVWKSEHGEVAAEMTQTVSWVLVGLAIVLVWRMAKLGRNYTQLAVKNLRSGDFESKKLAAEILAQPGHKNGNLQLMRGLDWCEKNPEMKVKILKVLANRKDPAVVSVILDNLDDKNEEVRQAAILALGEFDMLDQHFEGQVFSKHRVVALLEKMFEKSGSVKLKREMVKVVAKLNPREVAPWLLSVLKKTKDEGLMADTVTVIGGFGDASSGHWLRGFLDHKSPKVRASVIAALWQFGEMRMGLLAPQVRLLASLKKEEIKAALWLVGKVRNKAEKERLWKWMKEGDLEMRFLAAWGLMRMGEKKVEGEFVKMLAGRGDWEKWVRGLEGKMKKRVGKSLKRMRK